jgi:Zn-dependent protease with chaperone function
MRFTRIIVATASISMAGCATEPSGEREKLTALPLAAAHSDITFMLTTGSRQPAPCADAAVCANRGEAATSPLTPFAAQVQRIAGALQRGARDLYPDLALRIPSLAENGFDIYVAADDEPGSVSSASGRIALNAALGELQPYDDWLAFVIAREMAHVIARHHEENSSASIAVSVIMNILLPGSGLLKSAASTIGSAFAASGNRNQQAAEADAIAINLLRAAGFSLQDIALSLAIAPAVPDGGSWSRGFRKSSDEIIAGARGSKIADASPAAPAESTR